MGCDDVEDEGDGVSVRVKEGVRVLRDRGLRKATFRSLSNGEGYTYQLRTMRDRELRDSPVAPTLY